MKCLSGLLLAALAACDDSNGGSTTADASTDPDAPGGGADAMPDDPDATPDLPDAAPPAPDAGPPVVISTDTDLSKTAVTAGRTCAEAPQLAVSALTATTATVMATPEDDCFVAGDEVLLINLQGTAAATANVGNWELLRIASIAGTTITFTTAKTRSYGATAGSDAGIGGAKDDQKVALIRVPHWDDLTIAAGVTVTAASWNGGTGGVLALRAGRLSVEGTLSARALGYRAGRWSQDAACTQNLDTEPGESIGGAPAAGTTPSFGGAGGIAAASGPNFTGNTPMSATSGHATAGMAGSNANGRTLGGPGATYGAADGSRLTMGSGAAGNLTCEIGAMLALIPQPVSGGGIVLVLGGEVTVAAGGAINATPIDFSRDVAASGGMVLIRGTSVTLGTGQVTAKGGVAKGGSAINVGVMVPAGDGYIVVDASGTVTGTTDPTFTTAP